MFLKPLVQFSFMSFFCISYFQVLKYISRIYRSTADSSGLQWNSGWSDWTITGLRCLFPVDFALFQDEKWSGLPWDSKSEGVPVPFGIDQSPVESSGVRWTPVDSDRNKGGRVKSSFIRLAFAPASTSTAVPQGLDAPPVRLVSIVAMIRINRLQAQTPGTRGAMMADSISHYELDQSLMGWL